MNWVLMLQFLILTTIVLGVGAFFLKTMLFNTTEGAVNHLNKETELVRGKQVELDKKIKEANEELEKKKKESQDLINKMTITAEEVAKVEREKIVNKARAEGEEIIAKAEARKDDIRKALEKEMDTKAVDFTIEILNTVLSQKAQGALEDKLNHEFLETLRTVDMALIGEDVHSAEIITANTLAEDVKTEVAKILKEKLKREITVQTANDPKVVSGMILRFGSLNLDGSLAALLRSNAIALKEKVEKR